MDAGKYDVSARMGMALAMKRLKHPLGSLLDDPSPEVSGAAMRAIYEARMNPLEIASWNGHPIWPPLQVSGNDGFGPFTIKPTPTSSSSS